jgi:DNA-binding HxlR family transcriptional regulator
MLERETSLYEEASLKCPYGELLKILGRPHTLAILYSFRVDSILRFTKLQKELELQPKILTSRLHELVGFGLLTRKSHNEIPPRVEYELTQKGKDLKQMFDGMKFWATKYQLTPFAKKTAGTPKQTQNPNGIPELLNS